MTFKERFRRRLSSRRAPQAAAWASVVLALPSLWNGLAVDDYVHRLMVMEGLDLSGAARPTVFELFAFIRGEPDEIDSATRAGFFPWWVHPRLRLAFFRPLTSLTHWLDHRLWPSLPFLMHAQSLFWLFGTVWLAAAFYRRVLGATWAAGLAALMFALEDAHGLPVGWLANRNALMGAFFGVAALVAHDAWRRQGRRWGAVAAPVCLLLALLCAEMAVGIYGYYVAYALFLDKGSLFRRLTTLWPGLAVGLLWFLFYDLRGYGAWGSGMYVDPSGDPVRFLGALIDRGPLLLLGQWSPIPADLSLLMSRPARHVLWMVAAAGTLMAGGMMWRVVRDEAPSRFFLVGMLLALIPICGTAPTNRLLMLVGLGAFGIIARFLTRWGEVVRRTDARRTAYRALSGLLVFTHFILAPIFFPINTLSAVQLGQVAQRIADSLPQDAGVVDRDVFLLHVPTQFFLSFPRAMNHLEGKPVPRRVIALSSGIDAVDVTRLDARTLILRPRSGYVCPSGTPALAARGASSWLEPLYLAQMFDELFRDPRTPATRGDVVNLEGLTVEVTDVTPTGRIAQAAFRFDTPLEDPIRRWMIWRDGELRPIELPAIGRAITLPPPTLPLTVR